MVANRNVYGLVLCVKCFHLYHSSHFSKNAVRQVGNILLSIFHKKEFEILKGYVTCNFSWSLNQQLYRN